MSDTARNSSTSYTYLSTVRIPFQLARTNLSQELSPNPTWASFKTTSVNKHKQLSDWCVPKASEGVFVYRGQSGDRVTTLSQEQAEFLRVKNTLINFTSMWPCIVICDRASWHVTVHRDMWPWIVTNFFIIKPTRCTNFTNLLWHETLHVSDSSSAYHQEFILCTLSNGICHTGLQTAFERDQDGTHLHKLSETCRFSCQDDPARKLSANLYNIAECTVNKPLLMGRGTVRNM